MSGARRRRSNSRKSKARHGLFIFVCVILIFLASGVSYFMGVTHVTNTSIFSMSMDSFINSINDARKFSFVRNTIHENYIGEFDSTKIMDAAFETMVSSLGDPYSFYVKSGEEIQEDYEKIIGIGVEIFENNGKIIITSVIEGSSAYEAGIKIGDYIVNVNGEELNEFNINNLISLLSGSQEQKIFLTVDRNGERIEFHNIEFRELVVPVSKNVEYEKIDDNVGYIKINSFEEGVHNDVRSALEDLNSRGIILDLRDNGGGDVDESNKVASEFLPEGAIIYVDEYKNGNKEIARAEKGIAEDVEVVVLGNGETASASESIIGALRDNNRATFVGEKTFGKGITQVEFFSDDGSKLILTSAKSHLPNGDYIHGIGINPDVEILYEREHYFNNKIQSNGDINLLRQLDPQYQKALEIVRQNLG